MFVRIPQIRNANPTVSSPIAPSQMRADPSLCSFNICVITVVENHQLHITEDCLYWIIVRARFRQTYPMQLQCSHLSPCRSPLAGMRSILIQRHPYLLVWIPSPHQMHELAYILRTLARKIGPSAASAAYVIDRKQIELTASLLLTRQDQLLGRCITTPAIGFDVNWLDIKEQQYALARKIPPNQTHAAPNRTPSWVITYDFALDAAKSKPPFPSSRRRCSRLIV